MTFFKNKVQKHEYHLRLEKISNLKGDSTTAYETEKRCLSEVKSLLCENVSDYDPNRFSVTLKKEHRKELQRKGILDDYIQTTNEMHDARNRYHSLLSKINRVRSVDFPSW